MYSNSTINRFLKKINRTNLTICWEWQGSKTRGGYGVFWVGHLQGAHRVMWEIAFGDIPDDLVVCHKCDNPSCVNPTHLWLGTVAENVQDMINKGRSVFPAKKTN